MMNKDAWPSHQELRSPYNHNSKAAMAEPHLKPSVSPETISQIANQMDRPSPVPQSNDEACQRMLSGMPDFPEMQSPQPAKNMYLGSEDSQETNRELNKLLNHGYRPLEKNNGEWSETEVPGSDSNNKKLLLE